MRRAEFARMHEPRQLRPGARIAIIGGGTVGLLACKQCLDHGYCPTVFEKRLHVGGVWHQDDSGHSAAYDSLYTNSSRTMMQISDFPFPFDTKLGFPTRREICRYYEQYCEHYKLWQHIQLGAEVIHAQIGTLNSDGSAKTWRIHVRRLESMVPVLEASSDGVFDLDSASTQEPEQKQQAMEDDCEYDALFVCSGQFWQPSWPNMPPGWERSFYGRVTHSQAYRNADSLRGRRLVIIGVGNSALDIALEAARGGARSVTIVCRGGTTIIPVADDNGNPLDVVLLTRLFQTLLPSTLRRIWFWLLTRDTNKDFQAAGLPQPPGGLGSAAAAAAQFSNLKEHRAFRALLKSGRIKIRCGRLVQLIGRQAIFDTAAGSAALSVECDEIILCTGYRLAFPFIEQKLEQSFHRQELSEDGKALQWLELYKHVMHPTHPTFCVFAIINSLGNESLVGELQARWALAMLSGSGARPRPSREIMAQSVAERSAKVRRQTPKFAGFVNYMRYCDELAGDIGCMPSALSFDSLRSPSKWRLLWALIFSPVVQAQYRLDGPYAWSGAETFLTQKLTSTVAGLVTPPPSRL